MKQTLLTITLWLLLTACGGSDKSGRATATAPTFEPTRRDSDNEGELLHQMPDSDQLSEAYDAILEKAGADDPELMEVEIHFSRSIAGPDHDDSHISVKLVSPTDKNKILFYRYDFPEKRVREPEEVKWPNTTRRHLTVTLWASLSNWPNAFSAASS